MTVNFCVKYQCGTRVVADKPLSVDCSQVNGHSAAVRYKGNALICELTVGASKYSVLNITKAALLIIWSTSVERQKYSVLLMRLISGFNLFARVISKNDFPV
jgi:hypothetical protein